MDSRRQEQQDRLPRPDAAHAIGALREVAERHVLAQREGATRVRRLLDVGAGGVDVIEEGEAVLGRDAAAVEPQHLEAVSHEHHLLAGLGEEDAGLLAAFVWEEHQQRDNGIAVNEDIDITLEHGDDR